MAEKDQELHSNFFIFYYFLENGTKFVSEN